MSELHAHFILRQQQAFQRLLDGNNARAQAAAPSTSGGKSWNRPSPLKAAALPKIDVNARDWLGRTVLHLAAASQDASATEYVRMLLAHPDINVNVTDKESKWTALHRALYRGNLASAILLLQRPEIDTSLRDSEGYTAFDLYNSTVENTKPESRDASRADLFTWGANRNAALGLGHGDDRLHPEQVVVHPPKGTPVSEEENLDARFSPIHVKDVVMSKLHTAVVTAESRGNLRVCGFGSGGRLGQGQNTQYNLIPLSQLNSTITAVALGQDHTLAVTKAGEVLSWGLNRFAQLGYVVEPPAGVAGRAEEPIQATARKVGGPLKNRVVVGVAACKTASACWTREELFTWGTNSGQLGYDRSAHPVQVLPRIVTKVLYSIRSVSITDAAMACLLVTNDVVLVWNDESRKINFPGHAFPSEIAVYRPPQAMSNNRIEKITSSENLFAALSSNGEVFTFTVPPPPAPAADGTPSKQRPSISPKRVWALRKNFSAVKYSSFIISRQDVALGADGSIIICTESGHAFVRSRNGNAGQGGMGKASKFQQVPYMQRVVRVCANTTGAYGALRVDYEPQPIRIVGNVLAQDLAEMQPWMRAEGLGEGEESIATVGEGVEREEREEMRAVEVGGKDDWDNETLMGEDLREKKIQVVETLQAVEIQREKEIQAVKLPREKKIRAVEALQAVEMVREKKIQAVEVFQAVEMPREEESDEEDEDEAVRKDVNQMKLLCALLERMNAGATPWDDAHLLHGADLIVHVPPKWTIPVHRVMLAARSAVFASILRGGPPVEEHERGMLIEMLPANVDLSRSTLKLIGCNPMAVLLLLTYLYSDDLPALWDHRVRGAVERELAELGIEHAQVKADIQHLARTLSLPLLEEVLEAPVKRMPRQSLSEDMRRLFEASNGALASAKASGEVPLTPDVVLRLADRDVRVYSVLLRARSSFFAAFFDDEDWTTKRWNEDGVIEVEFGHLRWREMEYVMQFLCCGGDQEMFESIDDVHSVDELLDLMLDIIAAANELHLHRLILLCSQVILKRVNVNNVCSLFADASHYHAMSLVHALQQYAAVSMETLLESHMLDELSGHLIKQLSAFVREQQACKHPVSRSNLLVHSAMEAHRDWIEKQDVPSTIVPANRFGAFRDSPKLSPPGSDKMHHRQSDLAPPNSPALHPQVPPKAAENIPADDEVFLMDDPGTSPTPFRTEVGDSPNKSFGGWRTMSSAPRVDMRVIMAEAQSAAPTGKLTPSGSMSRVSSSGAGFLPRGTPPRASMVVPTTPRSSSSSPWRVPQQTTTPTKPLAGLSPPNTGKSEKAASRAPGFVPGNCPTQPQTPTKTAGTLGLGPVIMPAKLVAPSSSTGSSSMIRRAKSESVWTPPPVQPIVHASSSSAAMSFIAIQQLQREQGVGVTKDKQSLLKIQEEERARQVEDDFLKWWAAEEARLQAEEQAAQVRAVEQVKARPQKTKKPKTTKGQQTYSPSKNNYETSQANESSSSRRDGNPQEQSVLQTSGKKKAKPRPAKDKELKTTGKS
ncbi:uncharacterized protein LAESUDRAFT_764135 [Laetiporus sulphureus 93-53]|uniref:BTB domain-containing protein n=1 Tax=Laetiporus sulphureus 93-53 TaxID=1314785 RepID=A0A165BGC8_9APHY|nr:uncharacterized protein LAESUDRAFT_764135 [Laetiporus sulphureus 93-53]KZT01007.1 hypothetical protein LAESUDRAFT_764135 [Laetiporus sulphureus 93-53]